MDFERFELKSDASVPVRHVVWQPGNGTRYELVFTPLAGAFEPETMLMSRFSSRKGRCMTIRADSKTGVLVYGYVMEKMGVNEADAAALLALISRMVPRECALPPGYDKYGCWTHQPAEDEVWGPTLVNGEIKESAEATG